MVMHQPQDLNYVTNTAQILPL